MIERLQIQGYQRHTKLRVAFDPHTNTIVGPTDAGKSSILRAIRWVVTNKPDGIENINWDTDTAKVTLWANGHKVTRTRGPGINSYELDGKVYKAFGSDVPPDIQTALNLGPVNFQFQDDLSFWFHDTPGQVSRNLNSIVNLTDIDTILSNLASRARTANTAFELAVERDKKAKEAYRGLAYTKALCNDFDVVEGAAYHAIRMQGVAEALNGLLTRIQAARDTQQAATKQARKGAVVVALGATAQSKQRAYTGLAGLLAKIATATKAAQLPTYNLSNLTTALRTYKQAKQELAALDSLLSKATRHKEHAKEQTTHKAEAEETLRKESGGKCPICGNPLKL